MNVQLATFFHVRFINCRIYRFMFSFNLKVVDVVKPRRLCHDGGNINQELPRRRRIHESPCNYNQHHALEHSVQETLPS